MCIQSQSNKSIIILLYTYYYIVYNIHSTISRYTFYNQSQKWLVVYLKKKLNPLNATQTKQNKNVDT